MREREIKEAKANGKSNVVHSISYFDVALSVQLIPKCNWRQRAHETQKQRSSKKKKQKQNCNQRQKKKNCGFWKISANAMRHWSPDKPFASFFFWLFLCFFSSLKQFFLSCFEYTFLNKAMHFGSIVQDFIFMSMHWHVRRKCVTVTSANTLTYQFFGYIWLLVELMVKVYLNHFIVK